MPPFALSESDLANVVAYIHDQKRKAESNEGDRRTVDVADLQTGQRPGRAAVLQRPRRLREMPSADRRLRRAGDPAAGAAAAPAHALSERPRPRRQAAVCADRDRYAAERRAGHRPARVSGRVHHLADRRGGWYTIVAGVDGEGGGGRQAQAHAALLPKYTDADMHDVLAYLQTLK